MGRYMTIKEASEKWSIGELRINTLCLEGRIEGASKLGMMRVIPADTEKPKYERIKECMTWRETIKRIGARYEVR